MGSLVVCLDTEQWQGLVKDQHKTWLASGMAGSGFTHDENFFFQCCLPKPRCGLCLMHLARNAKGHGRILSRVGKQHLHFKSPWNLQLRLASDLFFCHRCATTSFSSKQELLHRGWSGEDESPQQIQNLSNPGACTSCVLRSL